MGNRYSIGLILALLHISTITAQDTRTYPHDLTAALMPSAQEFRQIIESPAKLQFIEEHHSGVLSLRVGLRTSYRPGKPVPAVAPINPPALIEDTEDSVPLLQDRRTVDRPRPGESLRLPFNDSLAVMCGVEDQIRPIEITHNETVLYAAPGLQVSFTPDIVLDIGMPIWYHRQENDYGVLAKVQFAW